MVTSAAESTPSSPNDNADEAKCRSVQIRDGRRTAEVCEVLHSVCGVKTSPVVDEIRQELHCGLMGKNPNNSRRRT